METLPDLPLFSFMGMVVFVNIFLWLLFFQRQRFISPDSFNQTLLFFYLQHNRRVAIVSETLSRVFWLFRVVKGIVVYVPPYIRMYEGVCF